jgi:erythromycin esterase-like protein
MADKTFAAALREAAHPLNGERADYDPLLDFIGEASIVLIGEASHGSHEFYRERATITKRLIAEKGFGLVAIEGDWPDAYRVNRYVRGESSEPRDADAAEALSGFRRFPQWMWRNADVLDFVGWLRAHNEQLPAGAPRVGFYGLDLYSLHASIAAVLGYLDRVDPAAAARARYRYACFDHFGEDTTHYGYTASFDLSASCETAVLKQLVDLRRKAAAYVAADGDEFFAAEQNARLVRDAEAYYRSMFGWRDRSWNLRDTHMAETLAALLTYHEGRGWPAKAVVWEHNSHLGDARATEMGWRGELNVGQLLRERYGDAVRNVGFATYEGTVTAADDWGNPARIKAVRPGLEGSYEALLHEVGLPRFLLIPQRSGVAKPLDEPRLERAIGVIYRPQSERASHYFRARLASQFDALIHIDRTRAVEPLETESVADVETPETFPGGV